MPLDLMGHDYGAELERLRTRIRESELLSDDDRENLLAFSRQLAVLSTEYSDKRHVKLLRHCTIMGEKVGGLTDALAERDAAERLVEYANSYPSVETQRDYRVALRMFGMRVLKRDPDNEGPPESLVWIKTGLPRNHDPTPSRGEMLDYDEDVRPMIDHGARNFREKALFAVQYEGGFRGQELYDITVGDVVDAEEGIYINVSGKNGSREVLLIADAVAYLSDWLEHEHPASNDPAAPLWSKLDAPERASYQTFLKYFKRAASRVGVEKAVTPTNFRKSNAYDLARRGFNAALIEDRQGRKRGSVAVARYIAQFGREADEQYLSGHGVDVDVDPADDPRPVECVRCGHETPRHRDRCSNCRLPFNALEAYEEGARTGSSTVSAEMLEDIAGRVAEILEREGVNGQAIGPALVEATRDDLPHQQLSPSGPVEAERARRFLFDSDRGVSRGDSAYEPATFYADNAECDAILDALNRGDEATIRRLTANWRPAILGDEADRYDDKHPTPDA